MMPLRTVSKIGSVMSFSAGKATNTSVPPRRSERYACSKDFGETASAIAWSAPPSFWMATAGSSSAALTVNSAPSSRAELELLVVQIDRDDPAAGDEGVLDRHVPEPADSEDGDEVRRPCAGDLDRFVRRHAGAGQRRRVERVDGVRHLDDVPRVRSRVLAEAAVDRVAHVLLLEAERLPAGHAVVARPARVAEPGERDPITEGDLDDAGAELLDDPDTFVAWDERRRRLHGPIAVRCMDVGVAEAGRLDPHPNLPGLERAARNVLDAERLREVVHDRGPVRTWCRAPRWCAVAQWWSLDEPPLSVQA